MACSPESQTPVDGSQVIEQPVFIEEIVLSQVTEQEFKKGAFIFSMCRACHTLHAGGRHSVGPNLNGLFEAEAATKPGFRYSKALEASGIVWSEGTLDKWIKRPHDIVPGTSMAFVGIENPGDRRALMAYLKKMTN